MRVRIDTLGCRVNKYDSAALRGELAARGYELCPEGDRSAPFDLYVLNSCTVTGAADAEGRRLVARARRARPGALIVLTGCTPSAAPGAGATWPVDLVVPNADKGELGARLDAHLRRAAPRPADAAPADAAPLDRGAHTRLFLKVQEGCDVRCAFCVVPDARGAARSVPTGRVVAQAAAAARAGVVEVVLVGVHLGGYGRDLGGGATLAGLVRRVLDGTPLARVRLGSLEPWGVRPPLLDLFAREPRLMPSLQLPLQSGSEALLRAMRRPITAARYAAVVGALRAARPDLALTIDVLCGFPGEGEREFDETCALLAALPWARLHVFPYSSRPGTPAAAFAAQVPVAVRRARARRLIDESERRLAVHLRGRVGQVDELLVERDGRGGHARDGSPARLVEPARAGELCPVELVGLDPAAAELVATRRARVQSAG